MNTESEAEQGDLQCEAKINARSNSNARTELSNKIIMPKFYCLHCCQRIDASDKLAGTHTICPTCGGEIDIPSLPTATKEAKAPAVEQASSDSQYHGTSSSGKARAKTRDTKKQLIRTLIERSVWLLYVILAIYTINTNYSESGLTKPKGYWVCSDSGETYTESDLEEHGAWYETVDGEEKQLDLYWEYKDKSQGETYEQASKYWKAITYSLVALLGVCIYLTLNRRNNKNLLIALGSIPVVFIILLLVSGGGGFVFNICCWLSLILLGWLGFNEFEKRQFEANNSKNTKRLKPLLDQFMLGNDIYRFPYIEICDMCKEVFDLVTPSFEGRPISNPYILKKIKEDSRYIHYTSKNTDNDNRLIVMAALEVVLNHRKIFYKKQNYWHFNSEVYFDDKEIKTEFVDLVKSVVENSTDKHEINQVFQCPFENTYTYYSYKTLD